MKKNQAQQIKELKAQLQEEEAKLVACRQEIASISHRSKDQARRLVACQEELDIYKQALATRNAQLHQIEVVFSTSQHFEKLDQLIQKGNASRALFDQKEMSQRN